MKHMAKRTTRRLGALALAFCLGLSLAGAALAAGTEYVPQRPNEAIGGMSCVYIDGYITYCIDGQARWPLNPFNGAALTRFTYGEAPGWDKETVLRMTRALEAGFPMDAYGLSALAPEQTDMQRAYETQAIVWDIVNGGVGEGFDAYSQALRKYVLTGGLPEGHTGRVDAVLVTPSVETVELSSSVSLADDAYGADRVVLSDDAYTGGLSFDSNKETGLQIISIPEGLRVTRSVVDDTGETKTEALEAGGFIRTCDSLQFEADGAVDGGMTFSYTSYEVVLGDSFRIFKPADKKYQRMIGYAKDGRELEFSVSFSLLEHSRPEVPPVEPSPSIPPVEPSPSIPPVEPSPSDPPAQPGEPPVDPPDAPSGTPPVPDSEPGDVVEIPDEDVPLGDLPLVDVDPLVEIGDEDVPLAAVPETDVPAPEEEVVVLDEDVPLGNLPQTGTAVQPRQTGTRMMASAALLAAAALFGAAALILGIKTRKLCKRQTRAAKDRHLEVTPWWRS